MDAGSDGTGSSWDSSSSVSASEATKNAWEAPLQLHHLMAAKMLKSKWGEEAAGSPLAAAVDSAIATSLAPDEAPPPPPRPHQPLDLSLSNGDAPPAPPACPDCRELRKEVREMRDSLHHLLAQFNSFTSRFPASRGSSGASGAKKARSSPPSSLSSLEAAWAKLEPGEVSSPSADSRAKLSSPDSASSADSAALHGARKRKLSSSARASAFKTAASPNPQLLGHGPRSHSLGEPPKPPPPPPATTAGLLKNNPYFPSLLSSHLLQQQKAASFGLPTLPTPLSQWQIQNILLNWQNNLHKPQDGLLSSLHNQNPAFSSLHSAAHPLFGNANLLNGNGVGSAPQVKTSSSNEVTPSPSSDDNSVSPTNNNNNKLMGSKNDARRQSLPSSLPSGLKGGLLPADILANIHHSLETQNKKKPGPDDFIKEFVETPGAVEVEDELRDVEIPVPEAALADPDFRPATEEEILGSSRWQELDWQEAVTRLAKKLAERRVFGPQLMAKATVAGTNHSNYPNLPMEGILYIEGVCRRTLFPQLNRREFAEFFRPAVKGLAARCRRIRHSMKPSPGTPTPHPLDVARELLSLANAAPFALPPKMESFPMHAPKMEPEGVPEPQTMAS